MHRKDYFETARALSAGVARVDGDLEPGGACESMDPAQVRRLLAVVAGGMANWFSEHNCAFDIDAFLTACGLFDEVKALTADRSPRQRGELLDYADVKLGDCLFYITSGGRERIGIVSSMTNLAVTLDPGWDLYLDEEWSTTKLRRSSWSRYHVRLMDPDVIPTPRDWPPKNNASTDASVVAQAFPGPPRPGTPMSDTPPVLAQEQTPLHQVHRPSG
jgi:hypothetical protein